MKQIFSFSAKLLKKCYRESMKLIMEENYTMKNDNQVPHRKNHHKKAIRITIHTENHHTITNYVQNQT